MQIEALSGIEAKIALVVLLAGGAVNADEVGERAGARRWQTVTDAARRLEEMGLVLRSFERERLVALAPALQVSSFSDSDSSSLLTAGANEGVAGESVSSQEESDASEPAASDGSSSSSSLNLTSRYPSFSGHLNGTVLRDNATALRHNATALSHNGTALSSGVPQRHSVEPQRHTVEQQRQSVEDATELGIMRVEEADALPGANEPSHQRYSPFVIRRKAQIAALLDLWRSLLPALSVTPESLTRLVVESGNYALPVAEMIQQTAERIEAGQEIKSPWGYIRSALRNQREKAEKQSAHAPVYHDPDELQPMTPEFQAQLDALKATAAKYNLWGNA